MVVPEGLHPEGRAAWRSAVATLTAIGEDPERSRGILTLYADAAGTLAILRRRWIADGRPVKATGYRGQDVVHPLIDGIAAQQRHAAALGETLLLSPAARAKASRSRGGRPVGTSQSEDWRPGLRAVTGAKP